MGKILLYFERNVLHHKVMAHRDTKVDSPQDSVVLGLTGWYGRPNPMGRPHRHNEVELNFIEEGTITYLFGGMPVTMTAGRLTLFWAAVPHRIIEVGSATTLCWLTIPLALFLRWRLSDALTSQVLYGRPVVDVTSGAARSPLDGILVRQWLDDVRDTGVERRKIMLLEIEARLRRLALALSTGTSDSLAVAAGDTGTRAEEMARFIAGHYTEELSVADVARSAGLHPNYAMPLFRQTFGMSIVEYLTHYRIANAQRLLATTDLNVLNVAMEAGFGSLSRFYAAFRGICGQSPRQYRATLRSPLSPHSSSSGQHS